MFFTQEDFRKIEKWLRTHSVKDTEFNESLSLQGDETISIVQNGHNKRMFIKDLISQIFKIGVPDFLNITDKYNSSNITLEEAIKLIPFKARKVGQVITFSDENGKWSTYQFRGALNQWNILEQWFLLY